MQNVVKLVNPLSLHITLCYHRAEISQDEKEMIIDDIDVLQHSLPKIILNNVDYFGGVGTEKVMYIGMHDSGLLETTHHYLKNKYSLGDIVDNRYSFVPHLTLFSIVDPIRYSDYKNDIDDLVMKFIYTLDQKKVTNSIFLYAVNSKYIPELQYRLN